MSKAALFNFVTQPQEVIRGVRRLGLKGAFLHGLRRAGAAMETALLGPCQLRINPMGAVCNHSCPMCWLQQLDDEERVRQFKADRREGMTLAEYVALFDSMPPGLTEVNVVGGGEPLMHSDCVEIMQEIKRRGLRGYLITNGTLILEPVATAMLEMGWDLTRVSVHAGDAETYRVVQGVDHFDALRSRLTAFDRLRRESGATGRCAFHIHHVLQRENIETIPAMFEFAEEVGADHVVFEIVFAFEPKTLLRPDELGRAAELLASCAERAKVSSNAQEIVAHLEAERRAFSGTDGAPPAPPEESAGNGSPASGPRADPPGTQAAAAVPEPAPYRPANRCSVGFDSAFITSRGDVLPCCFADEVMGNVREQPFRDIWAGEKYEAFRKRLINGCFAGYCSRFRCKMKSFLHD